MSDGEIVFLILLWKKSVYQGSEMENCLMLFTSFFIYADMVMWNNYTWNFCLWDFGLAPMCTMMVPWKTIKNNAFFSRTRSFQDITSSGMKTLATFFPDSIRITPFCHDPCVF